MKRGNMSTRPTATASRTKSRQTVEESQTNKRIFSEVEH
jgi:hypothetical protein